MKLLLSENRGTARRPARFVALLTAVLLLAALIPMSGIAPDAAAFADTTSGSGYEFNDITGELTVTDNDGTTAWKAWGTGIDKNDVKSVVFESGVTEIGYAAFDSCKELQSADCSNAINLETIGEWAFEECTNLQNLNLSGCTKLRLIDRGAFSDCNSLRGVDLSTCTSLTTIGSGFQYCDNIDSVILPANLQTLGDGAFKYCPKLANVIFPASLQTIGDDAFQSCSKLDNVIFPASLKAIGDSAFRYCTELKVLRFLGATAPTVGTNAFKNISATGTIYSPKGANGYDAIQSLLPSWALKPSSDARLVSVAGQSIVAGSQEGTIAAPKTASISVANSVADIGLSDIVTSDAEATKYIYSDRNFSANAASISLTEGADTHVYVKVVAENDTALYYDVTVTRADGENSDQTLAKVDAIKASQKTIYIAKSKKAVLPYIVYGSGDAMQTKVTLNWKASNKKAASVKNIKKNKGSIQAGINKNQKLVIKAGKKLGKSKITLTGPNGKKLVLTVKVVKQAKQVAKQSVKIKNLPKGKSLAKGQSRTFKAAFTKNATAIVTWKSSKPSVVKIDASGKITALKKGKATITLKVGGKTKKEVIRVKK